MSRSWITQKERSTGFWLRTIVWIALRLGRPIARALLYPIQAREPFGLVLAEAMACGTPVAALDRGAVREVVDDGVTGFVVENLDQMVTALPRVFALDRRRVREHAVSRFGADRMVDEYVGVYRRIVDAHRGQK